MIHRTRTSLRALLLGLTAAPALLSPVQASPNGRLIPLAPSQADFYDAEVADRAANAAKVELGRLLFFDKILSGNRNIACSTCHHPDLSSADGLALPLGEGAHGLGEDRRTGERLAEAVHERVPRNSPALFNLGAREFERMFHDGRVETDPNGYYEGGFITPAKWKLPSGLDSVLAAQAMFPVASPAEMAGQKGENPIADAVSLNNVAGAGGVWEQLGKRLRAIPEYVELFRSAYPDEVSSPEDVSYLRAANAIAAFETSAFRAIESPFDQYLRGTTQLDESSIRGMELFYGDAACSSCHSGAFQTDHDFHAIAMPQIGPGKGDGSNGNYWRATGLRAFVEDFGRGRVTVRPEDNFKFRTPSLRNVALTGPWGHAGAYDSLEKVVRHHLDPVGALDRYEMPEELLVPLAQLAETTASGSSLTTDWMSDTRRQGFEERDGWVQADSELRARVAEANELAKRSLTDEQVSDLLAFLESLTDPAVIDRRRLVPTRVPSGLAVGD